ncbi:protein phosphatase 1 regulatory subunit 3A [Pezoporus wallicus]|uniref:protein phosphatase 1 regulatory subunit 3A n=1 Tax=Pezoporus wallicus TaxID=35540 RepID=UPI00254DA734|nr:protein phosphatase 1 regulatory subunit 3A [Pezoporus wallicus]XP_061323676.1 protein phosphatase 1 regulatory subunit 3A isoform X1 [Pezoporus flaviventris]
MESFEGPSRVSRASFLEVPTINDFSSEDEDVKPDIKHRFSPLPRRRNSASSSEEEADTPTTISRKVSFADAFGFDLVSVKEFDTWEVPNTSLNDSIEDEVFPQEEYFFSQQFMLPASQEELLQKVREQKVLLESVVFLPGITCMNGIIRVLNVSFEKLVYVRMTLNNWLSYYDILAEFMPNSCGSETDQFCFKISLVPPYQKDGAKVEFCIRYETSVGTFWANNNDKNYTLICHKKETVSKVDNKPHKEITDRQLKGCLKTTQSSKEEIVTTSDNDTWNNSRTSGTNIPEIVYSQAEDKDTKPDKENRRDKNAEYNQGNHEEDEKELELLLSQHFTRARGTSSRDERNLHTIEPVNFPSETERLEEKLTWTERSSHLHPVPISSSSENASEGIRELKDKVKYSLRGYDSQPLGKEAAAGSVKSGERSLECTGTSESLLSAKYFPGTKQNEAIDITATVSSRQGESHTDISKGERDSASGSKMMERLFISEDDVDTSKGACETRPETISPEHDESIQLNVCIAGTLDGNANPALEHQALQMSHQPLDSLLSGADKNEGKIKMIESKVQVHLRGDLYADTFARADVSIDSTQSQYTQKKGDGEMSRKNYNTDAGNEKKVIEVADLTIIGEEEAPKPFKSHRKHATKALSPMPLSAEDNKQPPGSADLPASFLADERRTEDTREHRGFRRLKDREKSEHTGKGRLIGKESEANPIEWSWQETGREVRWGARGSIEPQSTASTRELFTCQEAESCEKSSVSEQGITAEAEAGTAYIIKTTSESAPEKMSASEKAVIAKLPQETALSDRPTEEKETAFDTHEGRNDGSHYALCQLNTVGVLYDTEFEKESVLGIYNACVHETLQGETMSVCNSREKRAKAQPDMGNILPVGETVKASSTGKKEDLKQGLCSEVSQCPLSAQKHLYSEKAEKLYREERHIDVLCHLNVKAETKMPPSGANTVPSYHYISSSLASSEMSTGAGDMEHLYRDFDKVAAESGYDLNLANEITCINKNLYPEAEKKEVTSTSDLAISREGRGRSMDQCFHQAELKQEKSWSPQVLISMPTKEAEGTGFQSVHLITEGKTPNWLDDSQKENLHISDSAGISNQKSEAPKLPSESSGLKHVVFKIFYFFFFLLFAATLYHYDLMVCLALYLFSLCWLYCKGGRSKESLKKE